MLTDQAQVKSYIAQYNLEDELSKAVNLAIKQNSTDPYLVISEYMKSLSTTEVEEDEEEDDVIMEEENEIPQLKARGRHKAIMAPSVSIPTDWERVEHAKSDEDAAFLHEAMATNALMQKLAPSDRRAAPATSDARFAQIAAAGAHLVAAFCEKSFSAGDVIIKQGDPGDLFYVVKSGECDISVAGVGSVMKATRGSAFGELALLHGAPRAATVMAETEIVAFTLDMLTFKSTMMGKAQEDHAVYLSFINSVELLNPLSEADKKTIAYALSEREYPAERNVICEGDEGSEFYLIREGEVKCTKAGATDEVSGRLKRGDFFGELALLSSDKRAATVTTVIATTVLVLSRAVFERVVGSLSEILQSGAGAQHRA